jgi:hypothetical protein
MQILHHWHLMPAAIKGMSHWQLVNYNAAIKLCLHISKSD